MQVAFNILGGAVNAAERRGDLAVKAPPLGGELNTFAAFFKQLYAQFVFQTANGLAEGGLRNVQQLCGLGHAFLAHDLAEILKLKQFHESSPYIS